MRRAPATEPVRARSVPPSPRRASRTRQRLLAAILLATLLLTLAAPADARMQYTGPDMRGTIRLGLGDGGNRSEASNLSQQAGDGVSFMQIVGLPPGTCNVTMQEGLGTNATFHRERGEVTIWADAGAQDAPYRILSHWLPDVRGRCTVEVDANGTHHRDIWGARFVILTGAPDQPEWSVRKGETVNVSLTITSNGTVPTNLSLALVEKPASSWGVTWTSDHAWTNVSHNTTRTASLTIEVPRGARQGFNGVTIEAKGSTWGFNETRVTLPIIVKPGKPAPVSQEEADRQAAFENADALRKIAEDRLAKRQALQEHIEASQQATPGPGVALLALLAVALAAQLRRRPGAAQRA